jgi:hypothetical protein
MLVDSIKLMYRVTLSCRSASRDTGDALNLLDLILEEVVKEKRFIVDVAVNKLSVMYSDMNEQFRLKIESMFRLSEPDWAQSQKFLSLFRIAVRDLKQLWASDSKQVVQAIGYALHNLPQFIRAPEQFNKESYMYCLYRVAFHWDKISIELREAFCNIVELEPVTSAKLINSPEFPDDMWGIFNRGEQISNA